VSAAAVDPAWNKPGGLAIQERRSFATWQVVVAAFAAWIIGMMVGYSFKKSVSQQTTRHGIISLPTGSSSGSRAGTVTTAGPTISVSAVAPATTVPTATTAAASAAAANPNAVATVLMAPVNASGPTDLPAFSTAGAWTIGWAFSCVGAPGSQAAFNITVVPASGHRSGVPVGGQGRRHRWLTAQR
jgi:hypothetical protein